MNTATSRKAGFLTPSRSDKRAALNEQRLAAPQPGDYWHEMFCKICLVIWADGEYVEYLAHRTHAKDVDPRHWTWDPKLPPCRSTLAQFRKWLSYGSIPGTWCDVVPNAEGHQWVVDEALEVRARRAQMRSAR